MAQVIDYLSELKEMVAVKLSSAEKEKFTGTKSENNKDYYDEW